ncbi:MAG: Crp/Fnr family transcriptional regulator [Elusimicrobia bacterium]|nr:Crp/Fnr family transcriptional regulator [Elusimicrobiota bacterium]
MTILRKVSLFKKLNSKDFKKIFSIAQVKSFNKGDIVFHKNEIGNNFFIVRSGKIKIFTSIGPNKKKTFAFLEKGDFFGEMSLLGSTTRSASAQAVSDSELLVISRFNFKKLLAKNTDFTLKLLQTLVKRLNNSDREIENMLYHNILGRLAGKIIELAPKTNKPPIVLNIDQNELAECIGTTRVPICHAIKSLKKCGAIDYKRTGIIILNLKQLESIANIKEVGERIIRYGN